MIWRSILLIHPILFEVGGREFVAAQFHAFDLFSLPSVHFEGANEGYVNTKVAMNGRALVAEENAYVGRGPLGVLALAVKANLHVVMCNCYILCFRVAGGVCRGWRHARRQGCRLKRVADATSLPLNIF